MHLSGINFADNRLLLDAGADPNVAYYDYLMEDHTSLHLAAELDEIEIFKLLLDRGAEFTECTVHSPENGELVKMDEWKLCRVYGFTRDSEIRETERVLLVDLRNSFSILDGKI